MSGLNPSSPAQPSLNEAYNVSGNAASKEPAEERQANTTNAPNANQVDQRVPSRQTESIDQAVPTSLAQGVRGAGPGEDLSTLSDQDMGRTADVDAEQMSAPGEGKVAAAVEHKTGAGGREQGLETDLDRKKEEQAHLRQQMKSEKSEELDVGGVLGQRGGPASTTN